MNSLKNLLFSLVLIFNISIFFANADNYLPYLDKYDHVVYNTNVLNERHLRVSRSLESYVYLNFKGLGKYFNIRLEPAESLFNHDFLEINNKNIPISSYNSYYEGKLVNENDSYVSGSVIDGVFYGTIRTNDGNYHIESSKRYNNESFSLPSHSIIYHEEDALNSFNEKLKQNVKDSITGNGLGCGVKKVRDWMEKVQKEAFEENINSKDFDAYHSYIEKTFDFSLKKDKDNSNFRQKREIRKSRALFPNGKSVCNLYLKVDPILYQEIYLKEGNKDFETTNRFLFTFLQKNVESLNNIFSSLQFSNGDTFYQGLRFTIDRTKIITEEMCANKTNPLSNEDKKLCEKYLDVETFLSYVSEDDFSNYCLGYTFTARDFADGTVGLAWVAKPSGSIGGVCEIRQNVQGVKKSLNSGIVTIINYNSRVPDSISQITFAHEVGHNFGSEHDVDKCAPGDNNGGNYIMYPRATSGSKANNKKFSECSMNFMSKIIGLLIDNDKKFCFKNNDRASVCGNSIVEENEECDCGFKEDCKEICCIHADNTTHGCQLVKEADCSPSQGSCCMDNCKIAPENEICLKKSECLLDVKCNGRSAFCPTNDTAFFDDLDEYNQTKVCNKGFQICKNGTCSGSICEKYNMNQCVLDGDLKNKTLRNSLCYLACETQGKCLNASLISSMNEYFQSNNSKHILKPGSECGGTKGYCDIFSVCRPVDAEGPLSRLTKLLSDPEILNDIKKWITDNWWAVVLIGVGIIILMGIFIKLCSVNTAEQAKKKAQRNQVSNSVAMRPIRKNFGQENRRRKRNSD